MKMSGLGWNRILGLVLIGSLLVPLLAACSSGGGIGATVKRSAFSSKEFGVSVSPRVSRAKNPPHGGGRHLVGKAYTVRGKVYTPRENPVGYVAQGQASWYGSDFHGRRTANGEIFSANAITGAHPTLPLPSYARVTNLDNGRSVIVRVNDRGPYLPGRIMDLSYRAADILGFVNRGTGNIQVSYVGPAPLNGDDTRTLVASINRITPMDQEAVQVAQVQRQAAATTDVASLRPAIQPSSDDPLTRALEDPAFGLLGYAAPDADNSATMPAVAAAEAMATETIPPGDWMRPRGAEADVIRLELGVFDDAVEEDRIASAFALLAAVDEVSVIDGGRALTRLSLSRLRPGVTEADILALARELRLQVSLSH